MAVISSATPPLRWKMIPVRWGYDAFRAVCQLSVQSCRAHTRSKAMFGIKPVRQARDRAEYLDDRYRW